MSINTKNLKRYLAIFILFILVGVAFFGILSKFNKKTEAAWFNDLWAYRKAIPVTNNTTAETNVYVVVAIDTTDTTRFQTDCGDIRFTNVNGEILPYFIDSPACGQNNTDIHVNFDNFSAGTQTIYIYYGNSSIENGFNSTNFSGVASDYTVGSLASEEKTTGPIAYWRFDEGQGSTANNSAGNAVITSSVSSTSDPNSGSTFVDDTSVGTRIWNNPGNALSNDSSSAQTNSLGGDGPSIRENSVMLVKEGTIQGTDKSTGAVLPSSSNYISYGGALDLWGLSLSPSEINASDFGVVFSAKGVGGQSPTTSHYLNATGFNFSIPTGANVNGILVEIKQHYNISGVLGLGYANVDHIRITVYYTVTTVSNPQGTITDATWTTEDLCVSGKCLNFNGSSAKVAISKTISNVQTVSFWVKPSSTTASLINLNDANTITATNSAVTANGFSSPTIYINGGVGSTMITNQWNHIEVTTATPVTASNINIGNVGAGYTSGLIDEVKFYPYVRIAAQVRADYSLPSTPKGNSSAIYNQPNSVLNKGLIGYWKMDEAIWNGTSNEVVDYSGNGNHGEATNGATTGSGKFGSSGSFTKASSHYVVVGNMASGASATMVAWIKPSGTYTSPQTVMAGAASSGADATARYDITMVETSTCLGYWYTVIANGSTSQVACSNQKYDSTNFPSGVWTQVAVTYDGTEVKFYKDAVLITTVAQTVSGVGEAQPFSIGRIGDFGGYYYSGNIDEARVYDRALSATEISLLYNWTPGPAAYWDFEEGISTVVNDRSASASANTANWTGTGANHWAAGKYGKAGNFNGSDDVVTATKAIANAQSVEFWVYPSSTTNYFIDLDGGTHYIWSNSGTVTATGFGTPTIYVNGVKTTTLVANTWQHVAVTTATPIASGAITLGKTTTNYLNGKLDEVKIHGYVRTQKQIVEDMSARGGSAVGGGTTVGYWRFDEGQGTIVNNFSNDGSALNGVFGASTAAPAWNNDGKFGKAVRFSGGQYVSVTDSPGLQSTTIAFSVWVNPKALPTSGSIAGIFSKHSSRSSVGYGYMLELYNSSGTQQIWWVTSTYDLIVNYTLPLNQWTHIVGTIDSNNMYLYINGVRVGTSTGGAVVNNALDPLYIGTRYYNANSTYYYYNGFIDELKIYNYVLTADEVKTEYNRGSALILGSLSDTSGLTGGSIASNSASAIYCVPGGAVACAAPIGEWKFDDGAAVDTSGNSYTGTITGTTFTRGKIGKGRNFTASDNITATIANPSNTNTVEMWLYPTSSIANKTIFTNLTTDGSSNPVYGSCTGSAAPLNTWTHLTVVSSGASVCQIYQNGILTAVNTTGVSFGTTFNMGSSSLLGTMDEVKIYNYARTAAQIAWDYSQGDPTVWWRFDDCQGTNLIGSYTSPSATLSLGASGQTSVGTCVTNASTPWYTGRNGKFNYSLNFDGSDDYVYSGDINILAANALTTTKASWGAWVYPTTAVASVEILDKNNEFRLVTDANSKPNCAIYSGSWQTAAVGANALPLSSWSHVLCTYDGASIKVYVNGSLAGTQAETDAITSSTNAVNVGKDSTGGGAANFSGQIDDVKIWNYDLTPVLIKNEVNQNAAVRYGPSSGAP